MPQEGRKISIDGITFIAGDGKQASDIKGGLYEVFTEQTYKELNVRGKYVLDIGCAFGDTLFYFAKKGAKMVEGYEINRKVYAMAMANARINKRFPVIVVNKKATSSTIDDFAERYADQHKVLKIDCEGGEYEQILNAKKLGKYDQIIIEYHYGYLNLDRCLKNLGFITRHTIPHIAGSRCNMAVGILYAVRKTKTQGD